MCVRIKLLPRLEPIQEWKEPYYAMVCHSRLFNKRTILARRRYWVQTPIFV